MPILLASGSPRRHELLLSAGIAHRVVVPHADETLAPGEAPHAYASRIARTKLVAVPCEADDIVLAADTIVVVSTDVLGKPRDDDDARAMLRALSGRAHEVVTAFAIAKGKTIAHEETTSTRVVFRLLREEHIDAYVASGEGRDKAGGYAAQGRAASFITRIEGSYTNVVGLPLCEVALALEALGVT